MALAPIVSLLQEPEHRPEPPRPKPRSQAFQRALQARAEQRNDEVARSAANAPRPARTPPSQQPARTAARPGGEREARMAPPGPGANESGAGVAVWVPGYHPGGQGGGGQQEGMAGGLAGQFGLAGEGELDLDMLLDLLPNEGESGIFELIMPDGDRLGVVADLDARQATFLLTPSSERLRGLLNKRKMELEKGLAQRMDRYVGVTVL
ncbi:hypothetical protein [Herbaspirillum sp. YR522]|uniref:hypothetical protein n=1 Tax=Herbaspirillum sp. YR522 TaxID=1144342 RepID=UPI00026F99F7|nr:hypothetical protein [Herbaspirillum sp. YR522]EJN02946.1 hypothetical protein PMI40_02899 [Herbaspirillum sp. YR522]